MLNRKFLKRVERQVNRKLRKHYDRRAYFVMDAVKFSLGYFEGTADFELRVGIKEDEETYKQKSIETHINLNMVKGVKEYVVLLFYQCLDAIDGYCLYTVL